MRKGKFLLLVVMSVFMFSCGHKQAQIVSGEQWFDTDGNLINAHGGGILYHDGTYYWYGEYKGDSTYWNPKVPSWECYRTEAGGVSCYSSKNLIDWKFEGVVLPSEKADTSSELHYSNVLERPKVIYNDRTKKFVMWLHVDSHDYAKAAAGVAVSDTPNGKFEYLGSMRPNGEMSRDMTLFKDDDGRAYHIYSSEENKTLYISLLSDDYLQPSGKFTRNFIDQSREAPAVFKRGGKYYILSSGCTGWDPNQAEYAIADSMLGEWTVVGNPCSGKDAEITFYGQSAHVLKVEGKQDVYIAMFDKWDKTDLINSRYIWLPVTFKNNGTINIEWRDKWTMNEVFEDRLSVEKELAYCHNQVEKTLKEIDGKNQLPRNIALDSTHWKMEDVKIENWTVGFFPGILWYDYENTQDTNILKSAEYFTNLLKPLTVLPAYDHDLGFQIFTSYGNAYRLTGKEAYKQAILNAADTLATLFNPKAGTILSWPREVENGRFAPHNTIIDNMINLEMLYWAAKNSGKKYLADIAAKHAETTMKYGFREDGGCYHVAVYDTIDGHFIKGVTHQGYADSSLWARGQAWAIYGYTMVYRETGDKKFLRFAEKVTDLYLSRLPENEYVPYWDFDAPHIPATPRDASAAAVTASALLKLSQLEDDRAKAEKYRTAAINILAELSSDKYQSGTAKPSFLLHSTGHYPNGSEIDASLIYADYYYIEALIRYKSMTDK